MTDAAEPEVLSAYWLRGAELMHQQCCCWGQNVRRPEGTLLIEYGFQRSSSPEGISGSSRYWLELSLHPGCCFLVTAQSP